MHPQFGISGSLWREPLDWQSEEYDERWMEPDRSEDERDKEGPRLARRLAAETGQPVEYMP